MADTTTTSFGFTKPEIGASNNSWGGKLHVNWDKVDDLLDGTTGITPNLLAGWGVGGTPVTASATELNQLAGIPGTVLTDARTATLTKGYDVTDYNGGTVTSGTYTPDPANGNSQYIINGGAFTLAAPASSCPMSLLITNNANAGAINTSAYDRVTGDDFTTTNSDRFMCSIARVNGVTVMSVIKV